MIEPEVFGPENARALKEEDRDQDVTYATMAQYPQPTDAETFDFKDEGPYLRYAHAIDKRLLTLNKGKNMQGEGLGFSVCVKCGCAEVYDVERPKSGPHNQVAATCHCIRKAQFHARLRLPDKSRAGTGQF